MQGYWNKPEETAKALRGGWLHTGDAAIMDEEGLIYIVDRLKDMIISGGENVYSTEVENAISVMPEVAEVSVIGIPDPKWGEAVHAIVVPRNGATVTAGSGAGALPQSDRGLQMSAQRRTAQRAAAGFGRRKNPEKRAARALLARPGKRRELKRVIEAGASTNKASRPESNKGGRHDQRYPIAPPARVGFFGLGAMGCGMAVNLVKAGLHGLGLRSVRRRAQRISKAAAAPRRSRRRARPARTRRRSSPCWVTARWCGGACSAATRRSRRRSPARW